jgi:hypothetical protein
MFFADPIAAFSTLLPAVRPGGRLCFACWAALEDNRHWLIPYEVALRHLGPPAPKPPHAPGPMANRRHAAHLSQSVTHSLRKCRSPNAYSRPAGPSTVLATPIAVLTGASGATTAAVTADWLMTPHIITNKAQLWTWDHLDFGNNAPNQNPAGSHTRSAPAQCGFADDLATISVPPYPALGQNSAAWLEPKETRS